MITRARGRRLLPLCALFQFCRESCGCLADSVRWMTSAVVDESSTTQRYPITKARGQHTNTPICNKSTEMKPSTAQQFYRWSRAYWLDSIFARISLLRRCAIKVVCRPRRCSSLLRNLIASSFPEAAARLYHAKASISSFGTTSPSS